MTHASHTGDVLTRYRGAHPWHFAEEECRGLRTALPQLGWARVGDEYTLPYGDFMCLVTAYASLESGSTFDGRWHDRRQRPHASRSSRGKAAPVVAHTSFAGARGHPQLGHYRAWCPSGWPARARAGARLLQGLPPRVATRESKGAIKRQRMRKVSSSRTLQIRLTPTTSCDVYGSRTVFLCHPLMRLEDPTQKLALFDEAPPPTLPASVYRQISALFLHGGYKMDGEAMQAREEVRISVDAAW